MRQIAEVTEHKVADNAKFSEVETLLSLRAAGWDQPPDAILLAVTIVRHFLDMYHFLLRLTMSPSLHRVVFMEVLLGLELPMCLLSRLMM